MKNRKLEISEVSVSNHLDATDSALGKRKPSGSYGGALYGLITMESTFAQTDLVGSGGSPRSSRECVKSCAITG